MDITSDLICTYLSQRHVLSVQQMVNAKLIVNSKEMMVRQSVTRHLDILCYGYNAGPKKLEKALSQGVMILNRRQFENLLETGEVPEEV
ncbi:MULTISPECIES: hypothetical protein [Vibrio harveyi group]|uniref:hypothetical protein n=1 Tax=Vibrio harveyi group TaxID=717610 RepID=UPI00111E6A8A|nr:MULTISPECIES: hypothetical protein [Vibrio harveyi group]MBE5145582.1 hypothetical protein [Vibrio parahaemolyticus]MBT0052680.1 hypothetical protein [Vibrio alginolyticus]MCR9374513.1 hypothetical protein [Vibrio alginolyticus]MCR9408486.1 hypothetical protein [Vibrio alginolyticus]TNZ01864.1 hypothetical protein CGK58_21470 [Vibrio parahaemolyticus]